jgi:hypothetical protein
MEVIMSLLRIALFFAMITSMGINNFSSLNAMKKTTNKNKKPYGKKSNIKFYEKGNKKNKKISENDLQQMKIWIILTFMQEFGISFKKLCWEAFKNICLQDKKIFFTEGISGINVYLTKNFFANVKEKIKNSLFSMKNLKYMFKIASKDACLLTWEIYFYMFLEYLQKNLCDSSPSIQTGLKNPTAAEASSPPATVEKIDKNIDIAIHVRLLCFIFSIFMNIKYANLQYSKLKFAFLDIFMKKPIILQYIMQIIIFYMICYILPFLRKELSFLTEE